MNLTVPDIPPGTSTVSPTLAAMLAQAAGGVSR
jgi:hypothetical protein